MLVEIILLGVAIIAISTHCPSGIISMALWILTIFWMCRLFLPLAMSS